MSSQKKLNEDIEILQDDYYSRDTKKNLRYKNQHKSLIQVINNNNQENKI